jgi:nucleotide-binding universal stress UspA family protein
MTHKLDTILIGIDLTPSSVAGAAWTARAFAPEARLILAHALDTRRILNFFSPSLAERKTEEIRREIGARLAELRNAYGPDRVEVRFSDGPAGVELARLASELNVDAIAVGAHQEVVAGGLLGRVNSTLLGQASIPVLIAHELRDHPPRKILAAVDESDSAPEVLSWARALAEHFGATGRVVHAVEPPGIPVDQALFGSSEEYERARAKVEERAGERVRGAMEKAGLSSSRFDARTEYGRAEEVIVGAAEALEPELIVIGSRGTTHGQAMMVGSVSRRVIEASKCPVFVIPPPKQE